MKGEVTSSREQPVTCATDGGRAHFTHFGTRSGQTISDIDKKDLTEEEIPATGREGGRGPFFRPKSGSPSSPKAKHGVSEKSKGSNIVHLTAGGGVDRTRRGVG